MSCELSWLTPSPAEIPQLKSFRMEVQERLREYHQAISKCKTWHKAMMLFKTLEPQNLEVNCITYNATLGALSSSFRWQHAIKLLLDLESADVVSFTSTMSAFQRANHWTLAIWNLEMLRQAAVEANQISYAAILSGKAWRQAVEIFAEQFVVRVQPNVISYGTLMCVYETAMVWKEALQALQILESVNIQPNSPIFRASIGACGYQWQYSLQMLGKAQLNETNLKTYNAAISACSRAGEWQQASGHWCHLVFIRFSFRFNEFPGLKKCQNLPSVSGFRLFFRWGKHPTRHWGCSQTCLKEMHPFCPTQFRLVLPALAARTARNGNRSLNCCTWQLFKKPLTAFCTNLPSVLVQKQPCGKKLLTLW